MRDHPGDFSIGVAAHPELHPRSEGDREADRRWLAAKLALADFAITQFFFEVDDYLRMVDELAVLGSLDAGAAGHHAAGCDAAGGPDADGGHERLGRPRRRCSTGSRPSADDVDALRAIGVEVATDLSRRLLDAGAPGLHLYALNRSESVLRIVDGLGLRPTG